MRVSGQLTVVWICSSLKVSHLLIDSLCIFVGEMSIQVPLTIRQSGRCFFLLLSCSSLDIPDSKPFIRYVICRYFLIFCRLKGDSVFNLNNGGN